MSKDTLKRFSNDEIAAAVMLLGGNYAYHWRSHAFWKSVLTKSGTHILQWFDADTMEPLTNKEVERRCDR